MTDMNPKNNAPMTPPADRETPVLDRETTFGDCVMAAVAIPEFVENFDRMMGTQLSRLSRRSPLDQMIDEATGRDRADLLTFLAFVHETVYLRLPHVV